MGSYQFSDLISDVNTEIRGIESIPNIQESINTALDVISQYCNWDFLLTQNIIPTYNMYSTGTVSVVDQGTTLTLTGGTWDAVNWNISPQNHKFIYFGTSFAPYQLSGINSPTQATLAWQFNGGGTNLVNSTYVMYQDIFPLPFDCSVNRDLLIVNQNYRMRLVKPARYTMESQIVYTRFQSSNYQTAYSDAGYDDINKLNLIKFYPIPSTASVYPIFYYRQIPYLINDTDQTVLPREFDWIVTYLATAAIKMRYGSPGWQQAKMEAFQRLKAMRRIHETSPAYDFASRMRIMPYSDSITDGYAVLSPLTTGAQ